MPRISETDLILNKDGSVYHLNLLPRHISEIVIMVGDPGRVYRVSQFFDEIEFEMNKREFITHTGHFNGKRITVISTGIGTDNVEIALTELDALVNIDLKTRELKSRKKKLKIIRIGTSGALQEDIPVGTHLISEYGIGLDNLMNFYNLPMTNFEKRIGMDIKRQTGLPFVPYVVRGSDMLFKRIGYDMVAGNTITSPGFYAPQGRKVRASTRYPKLLDEFTFYHNKMSDFWLTNFEMETAAYYALGRLLDHEMISVNAIIANRIKKKFMKNHDTVIDGLIQKVLERI
ncbi:nucleoside phosphorylase [Oscillatoria amoena NRMC-F 0135]|nr:nucleoside phosphorylase [Oscillatoria amoena NRMC-F 0135]